MRETGDIIDCTIYIDIDRKAQVKQQVYTEKEIVMLHWPWLCY